MRDKKKIAVVTGAGRGVGSKIAQRLVKSGAKVVLVARSVDQLNLTEDLISKTGGFVFSIPADISSENEVESIKKYVKDHLGQTDILVNAAGVFGPLKMIKDSDPENWIQTIQINLLGPYYMCRAFVGDMIELGWGRIINVSSAASLHIPGPLNSAYATSKVALNQLTRHLAAEITNTGVTAFIDRDGNVLKKLPQFTSGSLQYDVQGYTGATPYMLFNNFTIYFLCISILLLYFRLSIFKKIKKLFFK